MSGTRGALRCRADADALPQSECGRLRSIRRGAVTRG
jgi:hypothetical protein